MTQLASDTPSTDPALTRQRAESVLRGLLSAKELTDRELSAQRRTDAMRLVTGRSSLDNAIVETKRMIELLEQAEAVGVDPTRVITRPGPTQPALALAAR